MWQIGICMLLHLILKLLSQCLNARVAHVPPSLTLSILYISPMDPSTSWTSWCMHLPGPDKPDGSHSVASHVDSPRCGMPQG